MLKTLRNALKIKDKFPETHITAISMGPLQAENILKIAIARGADEAILACDKKFAGADTFATSMTLAHTIKKFASDYDLILCGQFAIDGDTAQTAPSLAGQLGINQITFVNKLLDFDKEKIIVQKETDEGFFELEAKYPLLLCVMKSEDEPRKHTIKGYLRSYEIPVKIVNKDEIDIDENFIGFKGSPTYVSKSFPPQIERKSVLLNGNDSQLAVQILDVVSSKMQEGKQ